MFLFFYLTDVPKLQPHPGLEKHDEGEDDDDDESEGGEEGGKKPVLSRSKNRVQSGPRTPNPYAADNSSLMFPILVAFGVFIPTLFCLCRLWEWKQTSRGTERNRGLMDTRRWREKGRKWERSWADNSSTGKNIQTRERWRRLGAKIGTAEDKETKSHCQVK